MGSSQKRIMIQDMSQQISGIGTFFNFNLSLPRARKPEEETRADEGWAVKRALRSSFNV